VIPVTIGATYQKSTKLRTCKTAVLGTAVLVEQYKTYFTGEITSHEAQTANTEQLQHYITKKHGFFQVYNCKYPAHRIITRIIRVVIIIIIINLLIYLSSRPTMNGN
jgi:hypothetical protein